MKIICVEGTHGCGKSQLVLAMAARGYSVLDEDFLNMPQFTIQNKNLQPQGLVAESIWMVKWFENVLRAAKSRDMVYITDRSPISSVVYSRDGALLQPLLRAMFEELRAAGIEIITIRIMLDRAVLWERITKRLTLEPGRAKYGEDKMDWMDEIERRYDEYGHMIELDGSNAMLVDALAAIAGPAKSKTP